MSTSELAPFTPDGVRHALTSAGYTEFLRGERAGFNIGDGRESRGEILVEARRDGRDIYITDAERTELDERLRRYLETLVHAGYRAVIDMRYVVVTGPEAAGDAR